MRKWNGVNLFKESEIPELRNRVEEPRYGSWRHKNKLSQIMTL